MPKNFFEESLRLGKAEEFINGQHCEGISQSILNTDGSIDTTRDYSEIRIISSYPEGATEVACNEGSTEHVRILSGSGWLDQINATSGFMSRMNLAPNFEVTIDRGNYFSWKSASADWDSALKLEMICEPPFDPEHYRTLTIQEAENEIEKRKKESI